MAATNSAMLARVFGSSLQNAFAQINPSNPQNLDLLQIIIPGDLVTGNPPTVVVNVDYTGAVHNPAVSPTQGTRLGTFQSNQPSGSTTAQFFTNAFSNPSQSDILQVINDGGNISYYLNYQGVATGS
jgi:hypothetical protein